MTTELAPNPLADGLHDYRSAEPALMVIFGATGDLASRKLLPAIYSLAQQGALPPGFAVVGASKDEISVEDFRQKAGQSIRDHARRQPVDEGLLKAFLNSLEYVHVDFASEADFKNLRRLLEELDTTHHTGGNRIFYCATPPPTYELIAEKIGSAGLAGKKEPGWQRIVVEKPFGIDLKSARELNRCLLEVFPEDAIFRIDHYLGKETVQNILAFRFANSIFEPVWNNQNIDSIQITVAEELGVEARGAYYDRAGALRDIVQNHAFQLLTLVAMEPPVAFEATAVRDEKVKVLRSIRPLVGEDVGQRTVRGQYTRGFVLGVDVPGYREERFVAPDSTTETYAALRLQIDNWRWADVPFYIRTGKRMPKRVSEIRIEFRRPRHLMFGREAIKGMDANAITLRIQPEEGISLRFGAKLPAAGMRIASVNMDFLYSSAFLVDAPDAYERLLLDCMLGDATLFTRADEVETAWSLIDPIEEAWAAGEPPLAPYPAGTWGPKEADRILLPGHQWHRP